MALELMAFIYFVLSILAFRIRLLQEDIPFAGNTENCQNEFAVGTGCPALDNVKNHPSNISVGNVKDHLLNAGCLLVLYRQLVPFKAIVLAFMIWQRFPIVIELLSAAGKMNHNWRVVLNAGCLILIHWQLVPFGAIVIAFVVWHFLPLLIGSTEAKGNVKRNWHKRKKGRARRAPLTNHFACATVFNIDERAERSGSTKFDSDSTNIICDNSANVHVCNDLNYFKCELVKDRFFKLQQLEVVTTEPMVLALLFGNRKMTMASFTLFEVKNVLYFPDSPVNILSVTKFADQLC